MSIISAQGLGKYFGAQDVFANVEFSIAHGDKIGLVGPNGAGKTTLLRLILGLEEANAGVVHRARSLRMGYLPQKPQFPSQQTVRAEMLSVFCALREQQHALLALAEEMAKAQDAEDLIQRYAEAERRFELAGGYTYENRIERVLSGLGFGADSHEWPIALLSGGQVTRACLAKLLLQEPDLLVLDEPTNYLDLAALEWLESYLQEWPQSFLVVSHDRYFLDKVTSRIWELNHGALEVYRGNYGSYVQQRRERMALRQRAYEEQQETIAKTEEFVRRYKAGQRTKEARGRETRLNRLERIEAPEQTRGIRVRLSSTLRAGDNVLSSDGALLGYRSQPHASGNENAAEHVLLQTGPFQVQRGQRVALLGPNGSGKTTFVRTVLGEILPLRGHIRIGASVRIGYLPQNQDWLDPEKTVLEQVLDASDMQVAPARNVLGRFLFSGDDVFKIVGVLSGGELSRLALAILTLRGANFLLLDEPTTHLDVESQEVLQSVLLNFGGTILFVSHDRYLVDALATHVWLIEAGLVRRFKGNYTAAQQAWEQEKLAQREASKTAAPAKVRDEQRRQERRVQRAERERGQRLEALEAEIEQLERELAQTAALIDLASSGQDLGRVQSLGTAYQRLEGTLSERLQEWEELTSALQEAQ